MGKIYPKQLSGTILMWWKKYIGLPFKERGRDMKGVDCYGLLKIIYERELKINLVDYLDFYQHTADKNLAEVIDHEKRKWEEVSQPKQFDVVLIKMQGLPMHLGVMCSGNNMIHCMEGINTAYENIASMRWSTRVMGFYRYA